MYDHLACCNATSVPRAWNNVSRSVKTSMTNHAAAVSHAETRDERILSRQTWLSRDRRSQSNCNAGDVDPARILFRYGHHISRSVSLPDPARKAFDKQKETPLTCAKASHEKKGIYHVNESISLLIDCIPLFYRFFYPKSCESMLQSTCIFMEFPSKIRPSIPDTSKSSLKK